MKNKEEMMRYQVDWHKKNDPGPGVIGNVPKLAEGAINPMWGITDGLWSEKKGFGQVIKRGVRALNATMPKKKERTTTFKVNQGIVFGPRPKQEKDEKMAETLEDDLSEDV